MPVPLRAVKPGRKPKYEIDIQSLTSRLPWFEEALERRIDYLMSEGNSFEEARDTSILRLTSLDDKTEGGYASVWKEFEDKFCAERNLLAMPASLQTGMQYIGWQAKRGFVHKESVENYLAAINRAHKDMLHPPPFARDSSGHFVDEDVKLTLVGMGKAQGQRMRDATASDRLYLPAAIPLRFLNDAAEKLDNLLLDDQESVTRTRNDLAVAFGYADFGRSQSQAGLSNPDIAFESSGDMVFVFREAKGLTKNKHNLQYRWPRTSHPRLLAAVKKWLSVKRRLGGSFVQFWRLPWEKKKLVGSDFDKMLQECCARRSVSPPPGFVYTIHSTRAGSLSEGNAIGVPLTKLKHLGGYSPASTVPETKYIDPSCPPSPAGRAFFGWLLTVPPRSS